MSSSSVEIWWKVVILCIIHDLSLIHPGKPWQQSRLSKRRTQSMMTMAFILGFPWQPNLPGRGYPELRLFSPLSSTKISQKAMCNALFAATSSALVTRVAILLRVGITAHSMFTFVFTASRSLQRDKSGPRANAPNATQERPERRHKKQETGGQQHTPSPWIRRMRMTAKWL